MKLKIISDGTAWGTKVVDVETGEELKYVKSADWHISADDKLAEANLTILHVPVEIIAEAKEEIIVAVAL